MTMQTIPGGGMWIPPLHRHQGADFPAFGSVLMDATAEKIAFVGRVFNKDRATKNISKVGFRPGTVTINAASVIRVSLQNVSSTAGPPYQPDGAQDQFIDLTTASLATNTWYQTAALSGIRAVAYGELLAVVFEYQTFTAADVFNVSGFTAPATGPFFVSGTVLYTGSWAAVAVTPNVILEFDDGTFGTLEGAYPSSALGSQAYNSGSTPDEYAMEFSFPFPCKVDAAWVTLQSATSAEFGILLYDGTSVMSGGNVSIDSNTISAAASVRFLIVPFDNEISLAANTTYRLSLFPTTANNVTYHYSDVAAAGHSQALPLGASVALTTRVNAGSWAAATTTRRPLMGIRVSACDDATGGSGTTISGTTMRRGMV